jgi:hypothetical protein
VFREESVYLLGCSADELFGIEDGFQLHLRKRRIGGKPIQQIVFPPFEFNPPARGLGMSPDAFVQFLSIAASGNAGHKDVLCSHKGQLRP